jgi:anti-sigma regulatory factor (Ser/Thr protein kinase)
MEWTERVFDASEVRRLRVRLRDSLQQAGASESKIRDGELVLTELVSNGLRYGADGVEVSLRRRNGELVVHVVDHAPGFDVHADRSGLLREGGRGLALVMALAHEFVVTRMRSGNHVRAVLALNGER